ncbi:hypothetical protein [Streptomyces sp. NPDC049590]|uniref:hypothetical protein n=1 Tax=Streptomyces sp. NPDC049590 TaxID=3154834 RepID=UPI0034387449
MSARHDPRAATASEAPDLRALGIRPVVSGTSAAGRSEYPIPGGIIKGKTFAIAVHCQGSGKLTVSVEPAHISFTTVCEKAVVPDLNEILISRRDDRASIKVTSPQAQKWAFAAGWDADPPDHG